MMNAGNQSPVMQGGQAPLDTSQMPTQPQPLPGGLGIQDESPQEDESAETGIREILEQTNIAKHLEKEELHKIGSDALDGYQRDKESRKVWEDSVDEWTKLASQAREGKTFPWPNASNVKYPLLTTAAMQFAARAYPSLIPSDGKIVKSRVIGKDPSGQKAMLADRVSMYMSYQLMHEMTGWEEGMDKLLMMLPIVGTIFKKTYWDSVKKQIASDVVLPKDLVVNYWAKSLRDAERISQVIELSPRTYKERQLAEIFLDVDLGEATTPVTNKPNTPTNDDTTPYTFIEQHTYLDLDKDGYKEPYVVTFHLESGKVVRIAARFTEDTMHFSDDGKLIKIEPIQYFTKFGFIPNPDGSFYDIGFGVLLGPINESVNTLINQMIDSGSLNNLQSGFLGKGLRIRMGETRFQPGEWKTANSTGDDLRKQIVPLPSKEPSNVLMTLMGSLITSGKELASVAEIFVGKMPGQNTPATTTMATIEQGMKVFTAVYKRLYRALEEEFIKVFDLNGTYLDPNSYAAIIGVTVGPSDFDAEQYKVCPGADPTAVSQTERLLKAQGLMEMLPLGILDPVKVGLRLLEAQEQPNYQELLNPQVAQTGQMPAPPPDPKLLESQAKIDAMKQGSAIKAQELQFKQAMEQRDAQFQQSMAASKADQEMRHKAMLNEVQLAIATHTENMRTAQDKQKFVQSTMHKEVAHRQSVVHKEQAARSQQKPANKPASKGK
jgi:chaperonin GroES